MDWGNKRLVDFNTEKNNLVLYDWSNNNDSIDVKMDGFVLEEKSSFKMLGLTFSKLYWDSYIISSAKTASKKTGALIHSMKFVSPEVPISINLPYTHAWNTAVTSGLVHLVGNWNC